jgi:hypothetical protein
MFYHRVARLPNKKTRPFNGRVLQIIGEVSGLLLLPRTLLVAVGLEALPAFVFRHLETALLLEISHGESGF